MPENVFLFQLLTAAEKNMREALEPLQSFEADAKQKFAGCGSWKDRSRRDTRGVVRVADSQGGSMNKAA
jgi:hypothetical protein